MSEPKRIALIPIGGGESLTQLPVKKDKKNSKLPKTQRFTLALDDSTEKSCPEFNFANLLASSVKKKDVTNGSSAPNALEPFDDEDEDQLRNIAKKFEEKYGLPTGKKKKSRKYDDYVDLGAGYDETDPFIDNTDAYDEVVPAEVTTAHGGFYINSGALEFKTTEKNSESESESSSSSSDSESDDSDSDMSTAVANSKKRRIIDSDEDSGEGNLPNPAGISETNAKKKRPRLDEAIEQHQAKPKKPMSSPKVEAVEVDLTKPIIPKDGGRVSQTKRDLPENLPKTKVAVNNMTILTSTEEGMKGGDTSQTSSNKKEPPPEPRNSLPLPVITNNEANGSSSSSSDSSDSSSSSSDSDSEEEDGADDDEAGKDKSAFEENDEASKLPNSLTPPTLAAIEQIKKAAVSSDKQGKCRFFSPEINRLLLAVELQARQYSCSKRQAIYTYLTRFLPCTKHTLLKRAKNLVLEDVESKLKPAVQKLQVAIEKVMGEQIERHATQCQRLAEANPERYLEYYRYAWDPDLEPAGASDEDEKKPEKSSKPAHPRRRFQWNKEIRSILNQVVYLKMECYNWSKLRKESASEYLMRFLESDIKHLWPKGWMTSRILFKESKEAHTFATAKGTVKPGVTGKKSVGGVVDALISSLSTSSTPQNLSASSNAVSTPNQLKEQAKPGAAGKKSVGVVDALIPSLTTSSTPQNLSASANAVPSLSQVKEQTKPGAAGKKSVGVVDALIPSLPTNSTPQNLSASSNIVTTLNQLKEQIKSGTAGKKSVGGVVDALIPPLPSNSTPQNLSTSSNAASTQNQVKEQTKSHPKERIPIAPPTLTRPEGIAAVALLNQVKEQAKSSQKERLPSTTPAVSASRSDGLAAVPRHENNGSFNKLEKLKSEPTNQPSKIDSVSKPRQRADTVPRLDNKDVKTLPRASGFSEAMSLVKPTETDSLYSTKSDYPADLSKNRSNNIRESIIQLCPDITVIKNDNHNSRPSKTESTKARFESTIASNLEPPKFNRADSLTSSDSKTQYDDVQCLTTTKVDSNTGKLDNLSDSSVGSLKLNKPKTSVVPSSSSLASFVDSGLRWSGRDSAYKSGESHGSENSHRKNMESYNRSESSVKEPSVPEQEDEESLLQRDLERVLEQIGQITNQVESKDHNPTQQSAQISVIGESKTKSVIKTTASANLASTMVVPNQTPPKSQFTPLPQRTITSSSGSTGSSNRSAGPATSSPSSSQIQQNQTGHIKYAHSASKMLPADLLNHMTSFTPNWQSYYASDSPEKRRSESTSPQHPPASQLHGGPSYTARSSPSTIHRNLPPTTTHVLPASSNSGFLKSVSHTVESMLQQTPHSQSLPIHESHIAFLQRKSQKPPENNYYSIHGPSDPANSS